MIRVTFKGSDKPSYYDYMIYPLKYRNYADMIEFRCYTEEGGFSTTSDEIKKIEKQVKDLTVKDLCYLRVDCIQNPMHIFSPFINIGNTSVSNSLDLNDYVDVTYILLEPNEKFEELNKCVRLWKEIK